MMDRGTAQSNEHAQIMRGTRRKSVPRRWVCAPPSDSIGGYWIRHIFFDDSGRMTTNEKLELTFFLRQYRSRAPVFQLVREGYDVAERSLTLPKTLHDDT